LLVSAYLPTIGRRHLQFVVSKLLQDRFHCGIELPFASENCRSVVFSQLKIRSY
jgi:hypothetical protein